MSSRKPLNTENEVDIFTATALSDHSISANSGSGGGGSATNSGNLVNGVHTVQKMSQAVKAAVINKPTKSNNLPFTNKSTNNKTTNNMPDQLSKSTQNYSNTNKLNKMHQASSSFNIENSANGFSPTRSNTFGSAPRIVKRELWWKEQHNDFKVPEPKPFKPVNVSPKVDTKMANYSPPVSQRAIVSEKLQWNSQAAVNTWENFHHQPKGGNKRYPVEHVEWNALPKIDSGFIYTYEPTNIENNLQ